MECSRMFWNVPEHWLVAEEGAGAWKEVRGQQRQAGGAVLLLWRSHPGPEGGDEIETGRLLGRPRRNPGWW